MATPTGQELRARRRVRGIRAIVSFATALGFMAFVRGDLNPTLWEVKDRFIVLPLSIMLFWAWTMVALSDERQ